MLYSCYKDSSFKTNVECFIYWCSATEGDDPGTFMVLRVWNLHQTQMAQTQWQIATTLYIHLFIHSLIAQMNTFRDVCTWQRLSAWTRSDKYDMQWHYICMDTNHTHEKHSKEKSDTSLKMSCVFTHFNSHARFPGVTVYSYILHANVMQGPSKTLHEWASKKCMCTPTLTRSE